MIQLRNKIGTAAPETLANEGAKKTEEYIEEYKAGASTFDFDSAIYGHDKVKEKLRTLQSHKCCFCESTIGHISYGDVEHFRPKAGWVQDDEPINKPGYYWLAYDWDNLLLSCQICNQRYKKNYFPLINDKRATDHNSDIKLEEPFFIHPVFDNPELHIEFNENIPKKKTERGERTIEKLGLDRELLNEQRRKTLKNVKTIYKLAKGIPETNIELKAEAKAEIQEIYNEAQKDSTEYASMLRCFFKKYPINF